MLLLFLVHTVDLTELLKLTPLQLPHAQAFDVSREYPLLRASTEAGLGVWHSKLIPSASNSWFLRHDSVMRLPKGRRAGRAMLIKVFVEPEAEDTTS